MQHSSLLGTTAGVNPPSEILEPVKALLPLPAEDVGTPVSAGPGYLLRAPQFKA